ncbi:hypothetical protein LUZ60_012052 [Juncus effusus]|nr:hypothetical protein LUZ60_012052 [Juncus effusus]
MKATRSSNLPLAPLDPEIERTHLERRRAIPVTPKAAEETEKVENSDSGSDPPTPRASPHATTVWYCTTTGPEFQDPYGSSPIVTNLQWECRRGSALSHEFNHITATMMPAEIEDEGPYKLRLFSYSLRGPAKDWYYHLAPFPTTWVELQKLFLDKYFPVSLTASIRKQICSIQQEVGETLYEYYDRFQKLCAKCPNHQVPENLLIQHLYDGMLQETRDNVDSASGGAFIDKTVRQARTLIETMAKNAQSSRTRSRIRGVNEIRDCDLEKRVNGMDAKLDSLANMMASFMGTKMEVKACGVCTQTGYTTDACPTLHDEEKVTTTACGIFKLNQQGNSNGAHNRNYDPYSKTYNPGWRDHPNFRWRDPGNQQQPPQNHNQNSSSSSPLIDPALKSLSDIVTSLATSTTSFQKDTKSALTHLGTQIAQISSELNQLKTQGSSQLPSQTLNPRENAGAITLRSGKEIEGSKGNMQGEGEIEVIKPESEKMKEKPKEIPPYKPRAPFPSRLAVNTKKDEAERDILEVLKKVEVNIPLLDYIRRFPRYAKFLKDLCTNKRKLNGHEKSNNE